MTNNQLTDQVSTEMLKRLISRAECGDRYTLAALRELQERRKAERDSEPVAVVEPSDYVTAAQLVGEGPARKAVHELYEGALRIGDKLYRHAQPAPVIPDRSIFEKWWECRTGRPTETLKQRSAGSRSRPT